MRIKDYINIIHKFPVITNDADEPELYYVAQRVCSTASAKIEDLYDFQEEMDRVPNFDIEPSPNTAIHSPQGIKGTYQGIKFDSRWEYIYYRWMKDVKCEYIERNLTENLPYYIDGREHKFYPDFKTAQGFVEVKGIFRPNDLQKQAAHPEVQFIDSTFMKPIIKELSKAIPDWKNDYEENLT